MQWLKSFRWAGDVQSLTGCDSKECHRPGDWSIWLTWPIETWVYTPRPSQPAHLKLGWLVNKMDSNRTAWLKECRTAGRFWRPCCSQAEASVVSRRKVQRYISGGKGQEWTWESGLSATNWWPASRNTTRCVLLVAWELHAPSARTAANCVFKTLAFYFLCGSWCTCVDDKVMFQCQRFDCQSDHRTEDTH